MDVVVNSGEPDSKTYRGDVLGVDSGSDLGVLRVEGTDLPQPLKLGTARDLTETQEVYVFGFPFGKRLGKNITVSKSSVSSLRTNAAGRIVKVQVNGGMNPGNSGGPVTDAGGQVVGVAVAVIKNTQINFAVPSDHVRLFLSGRANLVTRMTAYRDGDKIKLPVRVHFIDPLGRVRKTALEVWSGPPSAGNKIREATDTVEPQPVSGDGEKQVFPLAYDGKKGLAEGEIVLPPLADPTHVYWMRPRATQGDGKTHWSFAFGRPIGMLVDRKPVQLKYQPAAKPMFADLTSNATLRTRDHDGEEHALRSNFAVGLREQPVGTGGEGPYRFRLNFYRITAGIFIDDTPLTGKGNTDAKQILDDLVRNLALDIEMDGDGNQTRAAADLSRVPRDTREAISDTADQVLQSLGVMAVPVSGDTLRPLQSWKTQRLIEVGPLGFALPALADLKFTYLGVRDRDGRKEAVISVDGTLRGQRGSEANIGGTIGGTLMLSPETGQVVNANATIKVDMDVLIRKQPAKANSELVVNLKRGDKPTAPPGPAKKKSQK